MKITVTCTYSPPSPFQSTPSCVDETRRGELTPIRTDAIAERAGKCHAKDPNLTPNTHSRLSFAFNESSEAHFNLDQSALIALNIHHYQPSSFFTSNSHATTKFPQWSPTKMREPTTRIGQASSGWVKYKKLTHKSSSQNNTPPKTQSCRSTGHTRHKQGPSKQRTTSPK